MQCVFHSNYLMCPLAMFFKNASFGMSSKTHMPFSIYNCECKIFPYSLRIVFLIWHFSYLFFSSTLGMNIARAQNNNNQTLWITIHFLAHTFKFIVDVPLMQNLLSHMQYLQWIIVVRLLADEITHESLCATQVPHPPLLKHNEQEISLP